MAKEFLVPGFGFFGDGESGKDFLVPEFGFLSEAEAAGPPEPPSGEAGMAVLMRHGTWFGSGVKQRMWWA